MNLELETWRPGTEKNVEPPPQLPTQLQTIQFRSRYLPENPGFPSLT
jgi:hypothetical protein